MHYSLLRRDNETGANFQSTALEQVRTIITRTHVDIS